jgi:rhamnogalacturonan endolyase
MGLHGPYALVFTTTNRPAIPDMSWMSALGLQGWVPAASRGAVALSSLSGMDSRYTYTVGFANTTAQYWGTASADGAVTVSGMKPGTYTMSVYKGELVVFTEAVSVGSGATNALGARAIADDPSSRSVLWRLGDWDGTPLEFLNGAGIATRHPQDTRNADWSSPVTVAAGSAASAFPAVLWKSKNSGSKVTFNLTAEQIAARTVRIGITSAYSGGRPQITVNSWSSATPAVSTQANSRHITIGTYRGNNTTFTYAVPATAFVVGSNTLTINVASGSTTTAWLAPDFSLDCIDLY